MSLIFSSSHGSRCTWLQICNVSSSSVDKSQRAHMLLTLTAIAVGRLIYSYAIARQTFTLLPLSEHHIRIQLVSNATLHYAVEASFYNLIRGRIRIAPLLQRTNSEPMHISGFLSAEDQFRLKNIHKVARKIQCES